MRGRRQWKFVCAAFLGVLILGAGPATSLAPIPSTEGLGLQHIAIHALETTLREGTFYAETDEKTRFFTKDQMGGVLAALAARTLRPDQGAFWQERAKQLWEASEAAFLEKTFYSGTLPAPSGVVCIDVAANSWALRAGYALVQAGVTANPDPAERVKHLQNLLGPFLSGRTSAGKPVCPQESPSVPLHQRPLLYLSLLETRTAAGSALDGSLRAAMKNTIETSFDGAFALPDGLFLAALNAQMLSLFVEAARVFPDDGFETVRDELAAWLQEEVVYTEGGSAKTRNVARSGDALDPSPGGTPDGHLWTAYALSNYAAEKPEAVNAGTVNSLLQSYVELFWQPEGVGFAGEGSSVYADYNLLPAILTRSQPVSVTSLDPSSFSFVVPALSSFTYPAPDSADSPHLYLLNQWTTRFTMPFEGSSPAEVLLPVAELGPFNLSTERSPFFPAPRLQRSGPSGTIEIATQMGADDPDLLRFSPQLLPGQNNFRLDAYVPAQPLFSDFGSTIRILLRSDSDEPVVVGTFQIELDATEIRIRGATLDNVGLGTIEVIDPVITEQLPEPHMRLLLTDVRLPPGQSELILGYTDIIRPEVGIPSLTRDLEGRDVITAAGDNPVQVLQGETAYVRATVRDNGALRSVQLRYRLLDQSLDLRMAPVEGQADVYAVRLPTEGLPTGEGKIQVVAIDAAGTGNLNESAAVDVDLRDPLLAGSIVLFVFSGTLFLASVIIWVKVRRKALR